MIKKHYSKIILFTILLLGVFLRFYQAGSHPALNPDEAALGYNAYSLLQTGRDEHGTAWPLHFKSFGDYKPGGYVYLAIPFIKLFGLTPLAVRLPNLLLSVLSLYFFYSLVKLLTKNRNLSLLSLFFLSVSPWHIHFSRGAWESSTALSFLIIGTYFFYKSLKSSSQHSFPRSLLSFFAFIVFYVLSLYTYHSARIIAPALALVLFLTNFKALWKRRQTLILPLILGILLTLPVAFSFLKSGGSARFGGVGITADSGPIWRTNELINHHQTYTTPGLLLVRLHHNKYLAYALSWAQKYSSHFEGNFLFVGGDEVPRSASPDMGQLYPLDTIFLLFGLSLLFLKSKNQNKNNQPPSIFILWLLIAPLASSLTFQAPSALRALPMTVPLSFFTALGLSYLLSFLDKNKKVFYFAILTISLLYLLNLAYFLDSYFVHAPKRWPFAHSYGFKNLVSYTEEAKGQYEKIYVTNKYDQPYILFLFFSHYPPQKFQQEVELTPPDQFGFSTVTHFDKYVFTDTDSLIAPAPNSLVIHSDNQFFKPL